jgi:hypothetical protein
VPAFSKPLEQNDASDEHLEAGPPLSMLLLLAVLFAALVTYGASSFLLDLGEDTVGAENTQTAPRGRAGKRRNN